MGNTRAPEVPRSLTHSGEAVFRRQTGRVECLQDALAAGEVQVEGQTSGEDR